MIRCLRMFFISWLSPVCFYLKIKETVHDASSVVFHVFWDVHQPIRISSTHHSSVAFDLRFGRLHAIYDADSYTLEDVDVVPRDALGSTVAERSLLDNMFKHNHRSFRNRLKRGTRLVLGLRCREQRALF